MRVGTNRFRYNAVLLQLLHCCLHIRYGKGQVPQPAGFRAAGPGRRPREGEQLYDILLSQGQVQLPGLALLAVHFPQYLQPQYLRIECLAAFVVSAYNGDMVYSGYQNTWNLSASFRKGSFSRMASRRARSRV